MYSILSDCNKCMGNDTVKKITGTVNSIYDEWIVKIM